MMASSNRRLRWRGWASTAIPASDGHLLRRVGGHSADADLRPMRTGISSLRRKLGDDAEDPTYIFTELRVGYRMPKGEKPEGREDS